MFGNTLVVPHADGDITCVKINQDGYSSEYLKKDTDFEVSARIRHTKTKATATSPVKDRHNVEIVQTVYATESDSEKVRKVYVVVEQEPDDTDEKLADALADLLVTSGFLTSLMGWES